MKVHVRFSLRRRDGYTATVGFESDEAGQFSESMQSEIVALRKSLRDDTALSIDLGGVTYIGIRVTGESVHIDGALDSKPPARS